METLLGRSQLCDMTEILGAKDKEVIDGNIILFKISDENNKHRYVFIGGNMVCTFLTNDEIYKFISDIGINLTLCSIAIGWEYIYFLTPLFKFINKRKRNDDDNLFKSLDYLLSKYGNDSFKKLRKFKVHSNYDYNYKYLTLFQIK